MAWSTTGLGNFRALFGDGTVGFALGTESSAGSGPRSVAVGDLDGDGISDVAVGSLGDHNDVFVSRWGSW